MKTNIIINENSITTMKTIEENTIDCIVTDPPYGLNFMGKEWDKALPPKEAFIEMVRVLKPGALAFIMSSPRQDVMWRMGQLLEESGFSLNQSFISWIYNSGFPKAYDISKGIDQKFGLERKVIGKNPNARDGGGSIRVIQKNLETDVLTEPASDEAKKWSGWKSVTGLKPALEVIFMVQKPLTEKTIVDNVLKWGVGGMNVDGCRIPISNEDKEKIWNKKPNGITTGNLYENGKGGFGSNTFEKGDWAMNKGRFPANIVVSDDALNDGKVSKSSKLDGSSFKVDENGNNIEYCLNKLKHIDTERGFNDEGSSSRYFDLDAWAKHNGILQVPKASTSERDEGLEGEEQRLHIMGYNTGGKDEEDFMSKGIITKRKNTHPTVKPIKLMAYLITLGCPQDGVVLDPFLGSGTTCVAAKKLGRKYIGIELNEEYYKIAVERVNTTPTPIDSFFKGDE